MKTPPAVPAAHGSSLSGVFAGHPIPSPGKVLGGQQGLSLADDAISAPALAGGAELCVLAVQGARFTGSSLGALLLAMWVRGQG